nr:hypothetical protein [Tanacetum cinerariifolium]
MVANVNRLLHHEVEGRVDRLVEEAEGLENQRAELVVERELLPTIIAQVGNHASNIQGDVRGVNVGNGRNGCSYMEFMACNPKDYDGKGGAIVYTRWIEKMESTRGRESIVGMTWEEFKVLMSKEFYPNNEMQKLETGFWCHAMVGAGHAAYTDRFHELARNENVRVENKRSRTGRAFATITNPVRKEYTGACFECGGTDHNKAAYPRLNHVPRPGRNRQRKPMAIQGGQGHTFNIDLIPFGHESFDFIVKMDWLSRHKAKIVCNEKVVRIPLPHGEILRVLGENPKENVRYLMSAKTEEHKLKDIIVVRIFLEVFPDDLSGLPPSREFKFRIDLIPREMPVAKSPYRLVPSEIEELSSQLRELHDKVARTQYFFKIDLRFGYHQLRVHADDISKTAFRTRYGHFKFTVMTFGLTNASATKEEDEMHLGLILELLKKEKLYAKFSKCELWLQDVHFLGHEINGDGIHVDPSKIEAVKN